MGHLYDLIDNSANSKMCSKVWLGFSLISIFCSEIHSCLCCLLWPLPLSQLIYFCDPDGVAKFMLRHLIEPLIWLLLDIFLLVRLSLFYWLWEVEDRGEKGREMKRKKKKTSVYRGTISLCYYCSRFLHWTSLLPPFFFFWMGVTNTNALWRSKYIELSCWGGDM